MRKIKTARRKLTLDTPFVRPVKENWYEVWSASGVVLGHGDAEAAAELVVANLPPGRGPAVPGTADDLGGAEPGVAPDPARR